MRLEGSREEEEEGSAGASRIWAERFKQQNLESRDSLGSGWAHLAFCCPVWSGEGDTLTPRVGPSSPRESMTPVKA
jgi:hypothetical protein